MLQNSPHNGYCLFFPFSRLEIKPLPNDDAIKPFLSAASNSSDDSEDTAKIETRRLILTERAVFSHPMKSAILAIVVDFDVHQARGGKCDWSVDSLLLSGIENPEPLSTEEKTTSMGLGKDYFDSLLFVLSPCALSIAKGGDEQTRTESAVWRYNHAVFVSVNGADPQKRRSWLISSSPSGGDDEQTWTAKNLICLCSRASSPSPPLSTNILRRIYNDIVSRTPPWMYPGSALHIFSWYTFLM